jgi:phasin
MAEPLIQDFVPNEIRAFAEQSIQQARKACDDLMTATQRAVAAFEGRTSSTQANAREFQHKVVDFSERNVAASLEFAEKLLRAKTPEDVIALHAEYVKAQMQALAEQARQLGEHAMKAAAPGSPRGSS